jgi:photosystem II stability/assembly factor-like uncharacterized protein
MLETNVSRRRWLLAGLAAPLLTAQAGCGGGGDPGTPAPRFSADGLLGRIVRRLRPSPAGLLAATDDGAFRRDAGGWSSIGLADHTVHDISAVTERVLLASARRNDTLPGGLARLVESEDAGQTWRDVPNDFGGSAGPEGIQALVNDAMARRLLATGFDVLAESIDLGRSWRRLAGEWHAFAQPKESLAFDPARGDVWYGGQDAIEGLALFRYRESSGRLDSHPRLMPSPSVVKGIRFVGGEPDRVIVSGEGGIVHTRDNGAKWEPLLRNGHRFYFDVLQDMQRPGRFITAGWDKNFDTPQPLIVEISDDDGRSWARLQHPDAALFGGAWSMALGIEQGRSVGYFGLYRGGVVRLAM